MEVEVRGDRVLIRLVRRILYRRIVEDVVLFRHDDDTAGVLTRGHLHVLATLCDALTLRSPKRFAQLFFEDADVIKRRAFRDAADGSRAKRVPAPEHFLNVFMCNGLVFAGEVQVDIRRFVAIEPKKHFKRNIKPRFLIGRTADGAVLARHVDAAGVGQTIHVKVAVFALWADIVRLKRVDLRDAGHGRDKRRTDRTTRANEIAV